MDEILPLNSTIRLHSQYLLTAQKEVVSHVTRCHFSTTGAAGDDHQEEPYHRRSFSKLTLPDMAETYGGAIDSHNFVM
jgi:hypothetical protein